MFNQVLDARHKGVEVPHAHRHVDVERAVKHALDEYDADLKDRGLDCELGEDALYTAREQKALVEALLRVYHLSGDGLSALLDQYQVLEVEREELWPEFSTTDAFTVTMQGRADALLVERSTGDLYIKSDKTAAQFDGRNDGSNRHDVQGLSEAMLIERRLQAWWAYLHADPSRGQGREP